MLRYTHVYDTFDEVCARFLTELQGIIIEGGGKGEAREHARRGPHECW